MKRPVSDWQMFEVDLGPPEPNERVFRLSRYLHDPFPSRVDLEVLRQVIRFGYADECVRSAFCRITASAGQIDLLLRFAERMARMAIAKREARLVQAGLLALAMIGQRANHGAIWRIMALLRASADELTPHSEQIFRSVSGPVAAVELDELLECLLRVDSDDRVLG